MPKFGFREIRERALAVTKRVDVAIGILVQESPAGLKVLIARRPEHAILGGLWELPGGKLEPGETAQVCLAREFMEELGVQVRVGELLQTVEHAYEHADVRLQAFFCQLQAGQPRNLHVAEHRWVAPNQLQDYDFPPANAPLMRLIAQALNNDQAEVEGEAV